MANILAWVRPALSTRRHLTLWLLFVGGLALIAEYITIAISHDFFMPAHRVFFRGPHPPIGISDLVARPGVLKVLLLLPATVLLSVGLCMVRFRLLIPWRGKEGRLLLALCLCIFTVVILVSTFVFHSAEVTDDENTYDFQAQTILTGRVVNPPPPGGKAFDNIFIINDGRIWVGKYTLGHPIVLALGMAVGFKSLLVVIFGVSLIPLLFAVSLELYGSRRLALLTGALASISPFLIIMSSTRLSHTTSAFFLILFFWLYLRARRGCKRSWLYALCAGLAIGFAFTVRPGTAVGFGLPFVAVMAVDLWTRKPGTMMRLGLIVLGIAPFLAGTLAYNNLVTGDALVFPFNYYNPAENMGFGPSGHTPFKGLRNLFTNAFGLNSYLFGFPVSLLFAFVLAFCKRNRGDLLNLGIIGGIVVLQFLYYHPGVDHVGPVYYYESIIPLILLSARGITAVHDALRERSTHMQHLIPMFLMVSVVVAWITFVPERLMYLHRLTTATVEPYSRLREAGVTKALVLVQSLPNPGWVYGYRSPDPNFTDDIIFCRYLDQPTNLQVTSHFPTRALYLLWYDASSGHSRVEPLSLQQN